jgi:hypothetical protein
MNQENGRQDEADIDRQVSDHFETLSDESTPGHLDQAVMREAKRAIRADNRKGSFGAWFRPVAFMAMVGLSLAIILDLTDTSIPEPASEPESESIPPATVQASPDQAIDAAAGNRSQATLNEIKRQEKSPAEQRQVGNARSDQGRLSKLQSAPRLESSESLVMPTGCREEQKSAPEEWWNCIESLREAGQAEAADLEFENLSKDFPDFVPPQ